MNTAGCNKSGCVTAGITIEGGILFVAGHGLFIKTSVGMTLINQSQITDNWGDGIKFHVTNLTIHNFPMNFSFHSGFCFHVSSGKQMFPIFLHVDAVSFSGDTLPATHCIRVRVGKRMLPWIYLFSCSTAFYCGIPI